MTDILMHVLVLATAVAGLIKGYMTGFTGQTPSVLGIAFGSVAAHAFGEDMAISLFNNLNLLHSLTAGYFLADFCGYGIVFGIAYFILMFAGVMIRPLLRVYGVDVLNAASGAVFCAFKYLFVLSLAYNLIGGIFPHSKLMKYARDDDGNLVRIVMLLGPGVMGSLDCDDLHHRIQLQDAKTIS